jgi:hypothetical protein
MDDLDEHETWADMNPAPISEEEFWSIQWPKMQKRAAASGVAMPDRGFFERSPRPVIDDSKAS